MANPTNNVSLKEMPEPHLDHLSADYSPPVYPSKPIFTNQNDGEDEDDLASNADSFDFSNNEDDVYPPSDTAPTETSGDDVQDPFPDDPPSKPDLPLPDSGDMVQGMRRDVPLFPGPAPGTVTGGTSRAIDGSEHGQNLHDPDSEIEVSPPLRCATQTTPGDLSSFPSIAANLDPFGLFVGFGCCIPRYATGSTITFNGKPDGFPPGEHYALAMKALTQAAEEWNSVNLGVSFKRVGDAAPAVFQLIYNGGTGNVFARAFFPDAARRDRALLVFALSFERRFKTSLFNIFLHELGHILGLRHEFADTHERQFPSYPWGEKNDLSVMNYGPHPSMILIQESDRKYARQFYAWNLRSYRGVPLLHIFADADAG